MDRRRPSRLVAHPPARRPQAERAETMRARLLDATIECLATQGYGQMSTNDVVRRARVSRGALAHHFPTKADLVTAAAQRLLDRQAAEFRERFSGMAPHQRTPAEALDVLWSFYEDPGAIALMELTVAARNHPELQVILGPVTHQIAANTAEVFNEFFPELAQLPFAEEALRSIHLLFAGLTMSVMTDPDADRHGEAVREFLKVLVSLSGDLVPLLPVKSATTRSRT